MNFHTAKIHFQKDSNYKCQFCINVYEPSRLVSEVWENCKDVPTKILKHDVNRTRVNKKIKDLCLKSTDKLAKVCWMHLQRNFKKLWNFSGKGIILDHEFLLSILNAFTVGIEEYYSRCNNVNDIKGLQILYHYCNIIKS